MHVMQVLRVLLLYIALGSTLWDVYRAVGKRRTLARRDRWSEWLCVSRFRVCVRACDSVCSVGVSFLLMPSAGRAWDSLNITAYCYH